MSSAMPIETWEALVDPYFRSLRTDYQCVIADRSDEDWWSTRIVYQNTTTAAEISYSVEFERVEVQLVRLVGGQRPPYPVFIAEHRLLHHFLLDSLLRLRAPELASVDATEVQLGAARPFLCSSRCGPMR